MESEKKESLEVMEVDAELINSILDKVSDFIKAGTSIELIINSLKAVIEITENEE